MPSKIDVATPLRGLRMLSLTLAVVSMLPSPARPEEARAVPSPREVVVTIDNFSFNPPDLTVEPGTTVTWENRDDIPHTVVDTEKRFRSHALDTGDRFSTVFATEGEFAYFCSLHPHMTGTVKVRGGGDGKAASGTRAEPPAP